MNQETKWYVVYDDSGYFMQEREDDECVEFGESFWDAHWVEVSEDTKFKFLAKCKKEYPESKFDALIFFSDGK